MAVEFQDYYTTLGVPRDASEADIKKHFANSRVSIIPT
jgi:curved DNA-binding protein